ncbi:TetR/AcrR family transcriptional regulator [Amycolatopsis sp. WQ 127309]|uniref:TetR/AcrR family transcriptional regulator n=1 Tax=Amycolatopsis sp. WQ 127309 TaxID=2932773 RepID=UPI001FF2F2EF|nr:TetR/AcrR family transcriptional regulator [Amycolatopsis sp. WQ 127309]UOZ03451.1 TetR/AcrR family transcriptional regulator [Amycolatopsis sp. WQ 127309]
MPRSAEDTRRKLFDASVVEFSTYGIAGARVERITASAGVNNALLYRYFIGKSELFDTVYGTLAVRLVEAIPFTPDDLPGYAVALVDYYDKHPEVVRLAVWHQLEHGERPLPEAIRTAQQDKVALIRQAQAEGRITTTYAADDLLAMILGLSHLATDAAAPPARPNSREDFARQRQAVAAAVTALLAG